MRCGEPSFNESFFDSHIEPARYILSSDANHGLQIKNGISSNTIEEPLITHSRDDKTPLELFVRGSGQLYMLNISIQKEIEAIIG